jgi:adenylylsulfate kinase-like enzyme
VEVFVDAPLEVCKQRDPKGLYSRVRRGELTGVSGIDLPYEAPRHSEIVLDTVKSSVEENARCVIDFLSARGFLQD